ncbi:MAG: diphosphomevalonate decarboxylase [Bacteriovoracaceae bacterium]
MKGKMTWESPSNIALVKYWGKKENQIPCNPSLSLTLKNSVTTTTCTWELGTKAHYEFLFEGRPNTAFSNRVEKYFNSLKTELLFLNSVSLKIDTKNSFPHSTGIASSASSFSSFALVLTKLEEVIDKKVFNENQFLQRASYLARLGSGSACRSLYGPVCAWENELYGSPVKAHSIFDSYRDAIIVVDNGPKAVSSSQGHALMNEHPFAQNRYEMATENFKKSLEYLQNGDCLGLGNIIEREALMLHGLMMSSPNPFVLIKPSTVEVISKVQSFRKENNVPVYFTLDAGPNVHLLYSKEYEREVEVFVKNNFNKHQILFDEVGKGPVLKELELNS